MICLHCILLVKLIAFVTPDIQLFADSEPGQNILIEWCVPVGGDAIGRINVLRLMIGISMVGMPLLYLVGGNVGLLFVVTFVTALVAGVDSQVSPVIRTLSSCSALPFSPVADSSDTSAASRSLSIASLI